MDKIKQNNVQSHGLQVRASSDKPDELKFRYSNAFYIMFLWFVWLWVMILVIWIVYKIFQSTIMLGGSLFILIGFGGFIVSVWINDRKGRAVFYDNYVEIIMGRRHKILYFKDIIRMKCYYKKGRDFKMVIKTHNKRISIRCSLLEVWNVDKKDRLTYEPELKKVYDKIHLKI